MVKSSSDLKTASGKSSLKLGSTDVAEMKQLLYTKCIDIYSNYRKKGACILIGGKRCKSIYDWTFASHKASERNSGSL